jgi:hypothetical protein
MMENGNMGNGNCHIAILSIVHPHIFRLMENGIMGNGMATSLSFPSSIHTSSV